MYKKPVVSVIIVHFRAQKILDDCLHSLYAVHHNISFEVIVIDNDTECPIEQHLKRMFPEVRYISSKKNVGFGSGNNLGVTYARGDYVFFLNSDTVVIDPLLDRLVSFFNTHKDTGIVAPLLLNADNEIYPLQGTEILTPLKAFFAYSFLIKLFPQLSIIKNFWMSEWDKSKVKKVGVVPGSACMMKKTLFERVGGFDEHFFLYFEEFDLCLRIQKMGYSAYITPSTKLIHLWGGSTKHTHGIQQIFEHSRFYYFKKNFGLLQALSIEAFLRINKHIGMLFAVLLWASFLRYFRIDTLVPFISDQGWFYLSALHMLQTGNIPLVGITSSHPWLHQGAYWTYVLSGMLWIFHFNPIAGSYLTAALDVCTVWVVYHIGKIIYNENVGIMAGALYATSPLTIVFARTSYHTAPIPFFTALYMLSLLYWIKGNRYMFPLSIALLCILYNFEISTLPLSGVLIVLFLYGMWKKRTWAYSIKPKILLLSLLSYFVCMLPMLMYDMSHRFPQTVQVVAWIGYKFLESTGLYHLHPQTHTSWNTFFHFLLLELQRFVFMQNGIVALFLFLASFSFLLFGMFRQMRKNMPIDLRIVLFLMIFLPGGIVIMNGVVSSAYLPVLLPVLSVLIASMFSLFFTQTYRLYVGTLCVIGICTVNSIGLLQNSYFTSSQIHAQGFDIYPIQNEERIVHIIENNANREPFDIRTVHFGLERAYNYMYLAFYMHADYSPNAKNLFTIQPTATLKKGQKVLYKDTSIALGKLTRT